MNGVKYHRMLAGLSQKELAGKLGVNKASVMNWENKPDAVNLDVFINLRALLGVKIDELYRSDYPDDAFERKSIGHKSRTENPDNPISIYRNRHNLTFDMLAPRLGATTRECARKACVRAEPLKAHLEALAVFEDVSVDELLERCRGNHAEK